MDPVHKNHSGIYQAVIQSLVQDVRKDLLIQFRWNVLTEGIAHRWKLWNLVQLYSSSKTGQ